MLLLTMLCVIVSTFVLGAIFFNVVNKQYKSYVRSEARDIAYILNNNYDIEEYARSQEITERITLIDADGVVLFDNHADINKLENHKDRPEVSSAYINETGEAQRYSRTLSQNTYYYAIRLDSGQVLRVSITTGTVLNVFLSNLHITILVIGTILIFVNIFTLRITKKIVEPLNNIDFINDSYADYDELTPYIIKIREQKQDLLDKIENIKYQNNAINTITENMKEGIVLLDDKKIILTYNDSICDIFEVDKSYIGKHISNVFRYNELLDSLKHLEMGVSNFIYEKDKRYYQVSMSPVFRNCEIKGTVILLVDITEKEQLDRFRREFSANVSHELKTPLMSISGYSELIEAGLTSGEDTIKFANKIKNEAKNMSSLVEDILLISQLDESNYNDSKNKKLYDENIAQVIYGVIDSLRNFAENKNIEIISNIEDVQYKVNIKLYSELVKNLIYNGIVYNVENGKLFIDLWVANGKMHFKVTDTGLGIDKAHQSRIFERFYRVEESRGKKSGGTGLGLSIVKNVTLYHNGEIILNSELGKGSTFEVII